MLHNPRLNTVLKTYCVICVILFNDSYYVRRIKWSLCYILYIVSLYRIMSKTKIKSVINSNIKYFLDQNILSEINEIDLSSRNSNIIVE